MRLSREQLKRILELEASRGFEDKAVLGGMDKFLRRWRSEIQKLLNFDEDGEALLDISYASLSPDERRRWVEEMLDLLSSTPKPKPRVSPSRPLPSPKSSRPPGSLDDPVTIIKGISSKTARKLERLEVRTVRDLLYLFPRRHLDYSDIKPIAKLEVGREQTVVGTIWEAAEKVVGGRKSTEAIVGDETGTVRVIWFNQPFLAKKLKVNSRVVISGKVNLWKGRKVFSSPEYEILNSEEEELIHTGRLVPVYPLTEGLHPRQMRRIMKEALDTWLPWIEDFLPEEVKRREELLDLPDALSQIHFPESREAWDLAKRRLAFDELFLLQLGFRKKKMEWQEEGAGPVFRGELEPVREFLDLLPFALTRAQERVLDEILSDLRAPKPMCRLLQGEVGSGKTVVALAAMIYAAASGFQTALMVPTEVLAQQHFEGICSLLGASDSSSFVRRARHPLPLRIGLLVGGISQKNKEEIRRLISSGEVNLIIGTHALIQKGVEFKNLGLVIVDEQHRFGVKQRLALWEKGRRPHLLVMSATPIPRTLALTFYGDLDLSVIDELPPGRKEVKTRWLSPSHREEVYRFIRREVEKGHQAFIIYPLIEESDALELKAATAEYERLCREVFPDLRLGLLHGRMSPAEKEKVMREFREGRYHILVSTSVVEVGVDVPNATVILIEGAERFGVAQLHQLRGRVRRSEHQSFCFLIPEHPSEEAIKRLSLLERIQDGFALAEEDLKLRGPGEFFGTRQSGMPDLKMAALTDLPILEAAQREAEILLREDPQLAKEEHRKLSCELERFWRSEAIWS